MHLATNNNSRANLLITPVFIKPETMIGDFQHGDTFLDRIDCLVISYYEDSIEAKDENDALV